MNPEPGSFVWNEAGRAFRSNTQCNREIGFRAVSASVRPRDVCPRACGGGRRPVKELGMTTMDESKMKLPATKDLLKTGNLLRLNEAMDEVVRKTAAHSSA